VDSKESGGVVVFTRSIFKNALDPYWGLIPFSGHRICDRQKIFTNTVHIRRDLRALECMGSPRRQNFLGARLPFFCMSEERSEDNQMTSGGILLLFQG
jgi:hypothetical protein